jgi:hypothetical protein
MSARSTAAVILAALVGGGAVVALVLASDHQEAKAVWAVFGPIAGWSFIFTGLYAWRLRPESRVGLLMILLGFAWFLSGLALADAPLPFTLAQVLGGLWGALFLQLVMTFPPARSPTHATAPSSSRATSTTGSRGAGTCVRVEVPYAPAMVLTGR